MSATPRTDAVAETYVSHLESNWRDLITHAERLEVELNYAQNQIERIKQNIGCTRGQTTTQFCAEVFDLNAKFDAFKQHAREWIEDAHLEGFIVGVMIECFKSSEINKVWNEAYNESIAAKRRDEIK